MSKKTDPSDAPDASKPAAETLNGVSLDHWRRLYDLADRLKSLAPWQWMDEDAFFGVEATGAQEPLLVSFLGGHGDYLACVAYQGWMALRDIQAVQNSEGSTEISEVEIPHLQAIFTSRHFVDEAERHLLRALERRYRGRRDWPIFRSFQPGYLPWPLTAAEAAQLTDVLRQALGVALRVEDDPALLRRHEREYLVRVRGAADGAWQDVWRAMPDVATPELLVGMDAAAVKALHARRKPGACVEVDLALTSGSLQPAPGARPQSMYALAVVDAETGQAYGVEVMQALEGVAAMWAEVPDRLVKIWGQMEACPRQVEVRSDRMMNVLRPLTELLPFRLTRRDRLPHVVELLGGLNAFLHKRP